MLAISIVSPWGDKIVDRTKQLEIRSWRPDELPILNVALVQNNIRLNAPGQEDPAGQVVAIIDITNCRPWVKEDCARSGCDEALFESGWLAWEISNIRKLAKPVKAVAKRKFYELSVEEIAEVVQQLKSQNLDVF